MVLKAAYFSASYGCRFLVIMHLLPSFRWIPIKGNDWYWIRRHIKVGMQVIVEILVSYTLSSFYYRDPVRIFFSLHIYLCTSENSFMVSVIIPAESHSYLPLCSLQAKRDPYRFRFPLEMRFVDPNIDHLMYVACL